MGGRLCQPVEKPLCGTHFGSGMPQRFLLVRSRLGQFVSQPWLGAEWRRLRHAASDREARRSAGTGSQIAGAAQTVTGDRRYPTHKGRSQSPRAAIQWPVGPYIMATSKLPRSTLSSTGVADQFSIQTNHRKQGRRCWPDESENGQISLRG